MYIPHILHQMAVNPHKRLSPTHNVKEEIGDVFPVAEPLLGYVGVLGKEKLRFSWNSRLKLLWTCRERRLVHPRHICILGRGVSDDTGMAKVQVLNVAVLDNPSPFGNPFQFEITFECMEDLPEGWLRFHLARTFIRWLFRHCFCLELIPETMFRK